MKEFELIQTEFQNYLLSENSSIAAHVVSTQSASRDLRLKIYSEAYRIRLHESLMTTYPILYSFLGNEKFQELSVIYTNSYPSSYRSIRWFGDQLPSFLNIYDNTKDTPYLSELAQFEWTNSLVFDSMNSPIVELSDMVKIHPNNWPSMHFQAHPSAYRLDFLWNVIPIWQAIMNETEPMEVQLSPSPTSWILWRKDLICQYSSIPADEAWAIDAMLQSASFAEICEGLCEWRSEEEAGQRAASLLKGWILAGLISAVILD